MGGHILRQRVPQDWVLLAATSREIKAGLGHPALAAAWCNWLCYRDVVKRKFKC